MSLIKSLREPRIFSLAIFDLVLAVILTGYVFEYYGGTFKQGMLWAVPIGVIVHFILGIDTKLNYALGISKNPDDTDDKK